MEYQGAWCKIEPEPSYVRIDPIRKAFNEKRRHFPEHFDMYLGSPCNCMGWDSLCETVYKELESQSESSSTPVSLSLLDAVVEAHIHIALNCLDGLRRTQSLDCSEPDKSTTPFPRSGKT